MGLTPKQGSLQTTNDYMLLEQSSLMLQLYLTDSVFKYHIYDIWHNNVQLQCFLANIYSLTHSLYTRQHKNSYDQLFGYP